MSDTFRLRLVASNRVFFEGPCTNLIFQTVDGEVGIMAHHAPVFDAVETGELRFQKENGEWVSVVVSDGMVECANNRVSVIVFSCELPEEIDVARAKEAEERAREQLRQKQSLEEYSLSKALLARSMARLQESAKVNHKI